eukprot:GILK01016666.1.p2 GENE.GILK01016666.1~~GILK01016666.1.p2  ORF type:complete len:138 (-),score=4.76 GILK01016666.1:205-618(-)
MNGSVFVEGGKGTSVALTGMKPIATSGSSISNSSKESICSAATTLAGRFTNILMFKAPIPFFLARAWASTSGEKNTRPPVGCGACWGRVSFSDSAAHRKEPIWAAALPSDSPGLIGSMADCPTDTFSRLLFVLVPAP